MTKNVSRKAVIGKPLRAVLPTPFKSRAFAQSKIRRPSVAGAKVVAAYKTSGKGAKPFPGGEKNVTEWYKIEGNVAVGVNRHPAFGTSYPVTYLNKRGQKRRASAR